MSESDTTGKYLAAPATGGPWAPDLQHGGPPSALLVQAAERVAAASTGRADLVALRYAAEFVRPVPVAEVTVTARVLRAARTAVLVEANLSANDRDCLTGRVWLIRDEDTSQIARKPGPAQEPVGTPGLGVTFPYSEQIEWLVVHGGLATPGPGAVWARPIIDVVEGRAVSGLQRAALIGDSASGISSELDWGVWSFVNVDLDVHLARPCHGEWLWMDAATQLGPHGSALTRSLLGDVRGPLGSTLQTLVLSPISG